MSFAPDVRHCHAISFVLGDSHSRTYMVHLRAPKNTSKLPAGPLGSMFINVPLMYLHSTSVWSVGIPPFIEITKPRGSRNIVIKGLGLRKHISIVTYDSFMPRFLNPFWKAACLARFFVALAPPRGPNVVPFWL